MSIKEQSIVPIQYPQFPEPKSGDWEIMTGVGQIWGSENPGWHYQTSKQPPQLRIKEVDFPPEELPEICQEAIRRGYNVGIDELDNWVFYRKIPSKNASELTQKLLLPKS
jgi:hypothetical protein